MDPQELLPLKDSSYFSVVFTFLSAFKGVTIKNYKTLLDEQGFEVIIKNKSPAEVSFHFKHDDSNLCNTSLDFDNKGSLINIRSLILPIGTSKKRQAKDELKALLRMLSSIAMHFGGEVNMLSRNKLYRLATNDLLITLTMDRNAQSGDPYVSVWCEYLT